MDWNQLKPLIRRIKLIKDENGGVIRWSNVVVTSEILERTSRSAGAITSWDSAASTVSSGSATTSFTGPISSLQSIKSCFICKWAVHHCNVNQCTAHPQLFQGFLRDSYEVEGIVSGDPGIHPKGILVGAGILQASLRLLLLERPKFLRVALNYEEGSVLLEAHLHMVHPHLHNACSAAWTVTDFNFNPSSNYQNF